MDKKTALIIMYASNIPLLGVIGWLVAFFAGNKEEIGGKHLTSGLILGICCWLPLGITQLFAFIFGIIGLVKVLQGDLDAELPLIGSLNWFGPKE